MDDMGMLVAETYRHFSQNFQGAELEYESAPEVIHQESGAQEFELPSEPGVLYHIQKSTSVFVVRTLASHNIREDYLKIAENPEDYPSLRLIDGEKNLTSEKLRFFIVDHVSQAEIIHDQINNRRFPIFEEHMCNLSDPGFSWWMSKKGNGFHISFNLSVASENSVKLGPLGDQQLATHAFHQLGDLLCNSGLPINIQNEINRIQFSEGESFLMDEFQDLFELGVIGAGLTDLFKLLARRRQNATVLETTWFYLQELASIRRFWIQIQYDLSAESA